MRTGAGVPRSQASNLSDLEACSDQHVRRKPLECGRERAIERTPAAGLDGADAVQLGDLGGGEVKEIAQYRVGVLADVRRG